MFSYVFILKNKKLFLKTDPIFLFFCIIIYNFGGKCGLSFSQYRTIRFKMMGELLLWVKHTMINTWGYFRKYEPWIWIVWKYGRHIREKPAKFASPKHKWLTILALLKFGHAGTWTLKNQGHIQRRFCFHLYA